MGPPRRQPPPATTMIPQMSSQNSFHQQYTPEQATPSGSQTPQPPSLGMSPASRYSYNLKVLRRRDPSIISIFDQFSHVCIYHHDGSSWSKHGYEGSMFLFERDSYPPYGFYIMNRVGMVDYIQRIYPEDDVVASGNFLIIRSYPDFLSNRLTSIRPTHPEILADKFSDVYAIPNIDEIDAKAKGRSTIVGLWMHATNSRESMMQVMQRLHSYIKRNAPYPEEFRYGPGKPPPPHRLRAVPKKAGSNAGIDLSDSRPQQTPSDSENERQYHSDAPSASSGELSTVDKLFKMALSEKPVPVVVQGNTELNSLFASAVYHSGAKRPEAQAALTEDPHPTTGISLLDSIFASASSSILPSQAPAASIPNFSISAVNASMDQPLSILSPTPSLQSGPQILTSQVLSTILTGLVPSRTTSAASTARSHPSSREGDNEDDGESDSPSMILDQEESDPERRSGPNIARMAGSDLLSSLGLGVPRPSQRINGDVTPRALRNGGHQPQFPSVIETESSISTVRGTPSNAPPAFSDAQGKPRANRPLVPFEPDSELWPYSRGQTQTQAEDSSPTDEDGEIVELNFEETSVLSDPDAFNKVLRGKKSAVNLRSVNGNGVHHVNGTTLGSEERGKGKKGKRSRKERDARAREDIEQSWDVPPHSPATSNASHTQMSFGTPASPSPCPSPELIAEKPLPVPEMKTPRMSAKAILNYVYGTGDYQVSSKGKEKVVNGRAEQNGTAGAGAELGAGVGNNHNAVHPERVKESLIAAIGAQPQPLGKLEKNEFMRELVMLIHTDKAFVETLWQDYTARLA